jgi:hypothetical protein
VYGCTVRASITPISSRTPTLIRAQRVFTPRMRVTLMRTVETLVDVCRGCVALAGAQSTNAHALRVHLISVSTHARGQIGVHIRDTFRCALVARVTTFCIQSCMSSGERTHLLHLVADLRLHTFSRTDVVCGNDSRYDCRNRGACECRNSCPSCKYRSTETRGIRPPPHHSHRR